MKYFAELIEKISQTKDEKRVTHLLTLYFDSPVSGSEKDMALKLLLGRKPRRVITSKQLKSQAPILTGYPTWMIERSEEETGNFIKTLSLLLRSREKDIEFSVAMWIDKITLLHSGSEEVIFDFIQKEIPKASEAERYLILKLLIGSFKSPVSRMSLARALSKILIIAPEIFLLRLNRLETENKVSLEGLCNPLPHENQKTPNSFPEIIPFDQNLEILDKPGNWKAFGKKDGIQTQLIKHEEISYLWSKEVEIISDKFPEILNSINAIPHAFMLQGQIIPQNPDVKIEDLHSRISKKSITRNDMLQFPVKFEIWNLDEVPQEILNIMLKGQTFSILEEIKFTDWTDMEAIAQSCRKLGYTGILLHHQLDSDQFFFIKATSYSVKAFLTYVELDGMSKHEIRSMTFGLFNENEDIIPIAKVESEECNIDLGEVHQFTKQNTLEKFGPVRTVKPELIFDLHFDSIAAAKRRKSGLILSNVTVDKKLDEKTSRADLLEDIRNLL